MDDACHTANRERDLCSRFAVAKDEEDEEEEEGNDDADAAGNKENDDGSGAALSGRRLKSSGMSIQKKAHSGAKRIHSSNPITT